MSSKEQEEALRTTILELLADIKGLTDSPQDEIVLNMVEIIYTTMDGKFLIQECIRNVLPSKKKIEERKLSYVLDNVIFNISEDTARKIGLTSEQMNSLKNKIISVDDETKAVLFKFFDLMVEICELYKKKK